MGEERLPGGKLNAVVRIGDTVRRPAGPWTPTVHALLAHLRTAGFLLAPLAYGLDEHGREMLEYLPGHTVGDAYPWPSWVWSEALLAEVGRALAAFHEAVAGFTPPTPPHWQLAPGGPGPICHHDLAPYNVVVDDEGHLVGIIDWDLAGPGAHRADLAFVAWQWVPLWPPEARSAAIPTGALDIGHRLRVLLDSYGLEIRSDFIDAVVRRAVAQVGGLTARVNEGLPAYVELARQGHIEEMRRNVAYLESNRRELQALVDEAAATQARDPKAGHC